MSEKSSIFAAAFEKIRPIMKDELKEIIIRHAADKMREAGIRSVSVDDICRDLGISKKTFYVHFETKEVLVDELLRRREQIMRADIVKKTKGKTLTDLVLNLLRILKDLKDVRQMPALVYDLKKYYPKQLDDHLCRLKTINCELTQHYLKQGVEEGFLRSDIDIESAARVLASLHRIMMEKIIEAKGNPTLLHDTKMAMDIFFRGLVSENGAKTIRTKIGKERQENGPA